MPVSSSDRFKEELSSLQHRYHIHHPFDKLLQSGRATREVLQMWAANRYYYQDTIPRKDAAIIANCPHSERRGVWAKHVVTHDVDGALSEWLLLTDALGLERRDVLGGKFLLPSTRFACDAYLHFCKESDWRDGMCASMTHLFAGDIHRLRLKTWPDKYPWLPPSAFVYFEQRTKTLPSEVEATLTLLSDHYTSSPERMERAKQILSFKQDVLWSMMDALWHHFFARECAVPSSPLLLPSSSSLSLSSSSSLSSPPFSTLLRILGSGAGGGVPQWNGTDDWNQSAREGKGEKRTQCSAAILCPSSGEREEKGWILVNCSPDFRFQWNDLLVSHPGSVLRGILFTDAELDHVSGLLSLRESKTPIRLFGTSSILSNIESTGIPSLLRTYTAVEWGSLDDLLSSSLLPKEVDVWRICQKRPKYADLSSDVLCVKGEKWVYVPCIPTEESLLSVLETWGDISLCVTDGTFFSETEMPSVKGHLPVERTLSLFGVRGKPIPLFTRLNHTNQKMDPSLCLVDGEEIDLLTLCRRKR